MNDHAARIPEFGTGLRARLERAHRVRERAPLPSSRELVDLLAEHEFGVGYFYLRKGSVSAALSRFTELEQRFPEYAGRDKLFFYSARALEQLGRTEEASRYYAQLIEKYPDSEYAKKAREKKEDKPTKSASTGVPAAPE